MIVQWQSRNVLQRKRSSCWIVEVLSQDVEVIFWPKRFLMRKFPICLHENKDWSLPCLWKRCKVALEKTVVQALMRPLLMPIPLLVTPPHTHHLSRYHPSPREMSHPPLTYPLHGCHPSDLSSPHSVTPPLTCQFPPLIVTLHHQSRCYPSPISLMCHPSPPSVLSPPWMSLTPWCTAMVAAK